jgi:preprotein translocase subunit SecG
MTPEQQAEIQRRQRSRSNIMAVILIALAILFFGITIAKLAV